jgi:hypothetical protein
MNRFDKVPALIGMETVMVLFTDPSKLLTLYDVGISSTSPFCVMDSSDATANDVKNGTLISIGNSDYEVTNVAPDGAGLSVVHLTAA